MISTQVHRPFYHPNGPRGDQPGAPGPGVLPRSISSLAGFSLWFCPLPAAH